LFTHICEFDGTLRARVAEQVARHWMKFSCRNDFGQFLHIDGFDIEDVYASEKMCKRRELEGEEKGSERAY